MMAKASSKIKLIVVEAKLPVIFIDKLVHDKYIFYFLFLQGK